MRSILSLALAAIVAQASATPTTNEQQQHDRELGRFKTVDLKITVTNLSYRQPMSPFFIAVHDEDFPVLYRLGEPAPENGLQSLAEEGNPDDLIDHYRSPGMSQYSRAVGRFQDDDDKSPLLEGGASTSTIVTVSWNHRYVSMASMPVNTNDCFVGFSARRLYPGMSFTVPGYDAGTEENNENCSSVPGPACADVDPNNEASGNGEGFVHVHRGIQGAFQGEETDLTPDVYDWRNPMLLVTVERA